jgi:purine-binding chemotaxis protein CheW
VSDTPEEKAQTMQHSETTMELQDLIAAMDTEAPEALDEEGIHANTSTSSDKEARDQKQYIRVLLGDLVLGIPLSNSLEIGNIPLIKPLPNLPEWVLGISNIRGEIVSIVDLKCFFGWHSDRIKKDSRFLIVHDDEMKVGIVVDGVMGILSSNREEAVIQDNPFEEGDITQFISAVMLFEERIIHLLDVGRLLASQRMKSFSAD